VNDTHVDGYARERITLLLRSRHTPRPLFHHVLGFACQCY
jgi:hypothetical protein